MKRETAKDIFIVNGVNDREGFFGLVHSAITFFRIGASCFCLNPLFSEPREIR
jgi:hypothetical protein